MRYLFYLLIILVSFISCNNNNNNNTTDKLQVYASIYPIYDFAKKIGGDKIDIYNITSAGSEPHDFELTSKDMANLSKANLFIYNGASMEHWADTVKETIKDLKYLEASSNINNEELDPHFWLSPKKAKIQMENIKNVLVELDSKNADYYNSNYNLYATKLDELDKSFRDNLQNIKNTNLVVTHPAFGHFCKEYNLNQVAIARDEADAKAMAKTINFIKNNNIKTIFYEDFSSSKLVDSIAKETGVKVSALNPIESLSEEYIKSGEDYFSIMQKNLGAITNGLNN